MQCELCQNNQAETECCNIHMCWFCSGGHDAEHLGDMDEVIIFAAFEHIAPLDWRETIER